ncbi:P-loop containing nucleoside triphosphate hydrolase protein [Amylocystis lapponica]|nr:P-loop containing nucleoside triphosphate hydrolase protein [Amylocystis lapponica]
MAPRENSVPKAVKSEKVKLEKVKLEKTKQEGVAARTTRRRDVQQDDDAEAEEDEQSENEEEGASPKGRKRARINAEGDSRPADDNVPKKERTRMKTLPRDVDGFIPGAIVRVQLKNFVTYDYVEFRPGPYLNMIFGPNGTGKSTIACAICLGLNFPPSVLGRASDLNSFVKIGTNEGHIEIELKGPKGKQNLVIRRMLSADNKICYGREINARMSELNVQISNLCTFLPQDKVSEFARMSPQQLLRETQRAAGDSKLTSWHDTLIGTGRELKLLQESMTVDRDRLKTMQERNEGLERDVQRVHERRQIERKIELLELILPFKEYMEAKVAYAAAKAKQRRLHEHVKALKAKNAPVLEFKQALELQIQDVNGKREAKKTSTKRRFQAMERKFADNERMETETEEAKNKLDSLKKNEKERLKDIAKLERTIASQQQQLDNPVKTENIDDINNEIKRLALEHNKIQERHDELQERQKANVEEESRYRKMRDHNMQGLKQLDDVSHRKLEDLTRWDRDAGDTVKWLRMNRDKFRMEVFEPPMLCLTPDPKFVNAIEACFNANNMKTFVAQCEEDYALLNRLVIDTPEALGRKARINTWYRAQDARQFVPPPMTQEEMLEVGFDGYAIDHVQCPEGLKWWLQNALSLHRTAIALDPNRFNASRAMELISRSGDANYFVGNVRNSVSRSRYGKRLVQNSTRDVRPAKNFVHSAIDPAIKQKYDKQIAEANQGLALCEEEAHVLAKDEAEIKAADDTRKSEYNALMDRKAKVVSAQKKLAALGQAIERNRLKLHNLQNAPSVENERERLKAKVLTLARKRADIIKEYCRTIRIVMKEQEEATRFGLEYLQLCANKTALEVMCKEQDQEYQRALEEFNGALRDAKEDSKVKLQVSKDKLDSVDDEIRAQFREMETSGEANAKTAEEVQSELEKNRSQLEMNAHTNPGVVDTYNNRKLAIESLTAVIDDREAKVERIERQIKAARDNWHPALQELVNSVGTRFSAAFDRLGCAGEIKIREHEDYDKWAIDILVKFRDQEKLQLLTGERQSGGERSLTTILYLMSLTEEARAPFSLVDEINQGMDQRAERAVHNSLVEVTCKEDSGQYFLITPKLLPDLNYKERMKVLCVNNGEWISEDSRIGYMMGLVEGYVKFHSRSNASA